MNLILPVKFSVLNLPLSSSDDVTLIASFNNMPHILKPPFEDQLLHLVNFPAVTILSLTLLQSNHLQCEVSVDLKDLITSNPLSISVDLKTSDQESLEITQSKQSISLLIQRSDIETSSFSVEAEHFAAVSQSTLDTLLTYSKRGLASKGSEVLGLENLEVGDYKELTPQKAKNIQSIVLGINEKLKAFELIHERLKELEKYAAQGDEKRDKILNRFKLACYEFLGNKQKLEEVIGNLRRKVGELNEEKLNLQKISKKLEESQKDKDMEIESLSMKLQTQTPKESKIVPINQVLQSPAIEIPENKLSEAVSKYESIISNYQLSLNSLAQENEALLLENTSLKSENSSLKHSLSALQQENLSLQNTLLGYSTASTYTAELESQLKKLELTNHKLQEDYLSLQTCISSSSKDFQSNAQSFNTEKSVLLEAKQKLEQEYSELKRQLIELEGKYLEIQSKSYETTQDTSVSLTEITKQNLQLLKDSKEFCQISNKLELSMLNEYNLVIRNIVDISSNFLLQSRLQSNILMFLRDKESEITYLKNVMGDIQKQKVAYIPVRGDYVDLQLANFLNSMTVPCEVPFTRLEPGVYLFGSKRVVLRVENIGIVIRVGGGFIKLEDYISNQSVFEIGRIKEREAKEKETKDRGAKDKEAKEKEYKEREAKEIKEREYKDREIKEKNSKPASPEKTGIDRTSSPILPSYTQRSSISTGIPMPKTVSLFIEKKGSVDVPFSLIDKNETPDVSDFLIKPIQVEETAEKKSRLELTRKSFLAKRNPSNLT